MDKSNKSPRCVVISGIDGSGKTTIINALLEDLQSQGLRTAYVWLRFNHYLTKVMHALARISGLSVKVHNEMGDVWQHRFYKSSFFCRLYILATYFDTLISRLKYNRAAKNADIVVCDRWITDIIVDLATKTHNPKFLDSKWAQRFFKILPDNARLFVVHRDLQSILDCRIENQIDPDFKIRLNVYSELLKKDYINAVNNQGTVADSITQIKKILIQ